MSERAEALARLRRRHAARAFGRVRVCVADGERWPCDVALVLADAVEGFVPEWVPVPGAAWPVGDE